MAQPRTIEGYVYEDGSSAPVGFDVTAIIGRVWFADNGDRNPYEVAFELVARNGGPGEFTFPMEDGGRCVVEVTHHRHPEKLAERK